MSLSGAKPGRAGASAATSPPDEPIREVMSRPTDERAIVDAGLKALAFASGPPSVWDEPAAIYHCDPTVNLYDWYAGIRHGHVVAIWPITARGAGY